MVTIRVPLWVSPRRPNAGYDFYREDVLTDNVYKDQGIMLRAPIGSLPEGTEFVSVTIEIDLSAGAQGFIEFLRGSVKYVPGGRVSRKSIWAAWAKRNDADPSSKEIARVHWQDVLEHFRTAFNAGDLQRKRLDGAAQRVWFDYELLSEGEDTPRAFSE